MKIFDSSDEDHGGIGSWHHAPAILRHNGFEKEMQNERLILNMATVCEDVVTNLNRKKHTRKFDWYCLSSRMKFAYNTLRPEYMYQMIYYGLPWADLYVMTYRRDTKSDCDWSGP